MRATEYRLDMLVHHPAMPDWGPGKILALDGSIATIYFRDLPETNSGDAIKRFDLTRASLVVSASQSDPMLDRLPPLREGKLGLPRARLTLAQAVDAFFRKFPRGFDDPSYLGDRKHGERAYKLEAHHLWTETLGKEHGRRLLSDGAIDELTARALAVDNRLNLLSPYEKMALREGLKERRAATRFFQTLFAVLETREVTRDVFEPYVGAVTNLPAQEGRSRVATWPVLTQFPYIAQPRRFMLLKPGVTQHCAETLAFDLRYTSTLNWVTYSHLLELGSLLMTHLRPRGARDYIDVQSFMWVTARLADGKYGRAEP